MVLDIFHPLQNSFGLCFHCGRNGENSRGTICQWFIGNTSNGSLFGSFASHGILLYTFIGYAQVTAGVLLLIPGTVLLGALIYLPIILNIWILSFAVRFEGSFVTSPLMVLANLYILAWHYDKLKYILPFNRHSREVSILKQKKYERKFPVLFFAGVVSIIGFTIWFASFGHPVMPRNSLKDCQLQFINAKNEAEGFAFCECIHIAGNPLDLCLDNLDTNGKTSDNI